MSSLAQRSIFLKLIDQACSAGARLHSACHLIGLAARTVQRWLALCAGEVERKREGTGQAAVLLGDHRVSALRAHNCPPNKLSDVEREAAMGVLNSVEYKDLPPSQIVPRSADQGRLVDDKYLGRRINAVPFAATGRAADPPAHRAGTAKAQQTARLGGHPA